MADITGIKGLPPPTADSVAPYRPAANRSGTPAGGAAAPATFGEILRARQGVAAGTALPPPAGVPVRFSAHAQTRLQSRNIALDAGQLDRLQGAVQKAAGKGSRDTLVMMDDVAMVVSVTNRTVVTVVDKENLKENVFTNIDSAVIA
jgi:flagellar operon protein